MRNLKNERGFSMVEVMVALVISALLLGGLVLTFTNANTTYAELTKTSRQIENGRYAISELATDLRHAGFYGEYAGTLVEPPAATAPQPCNDGPAEFRKALMVPVYGYDGMGGPPIACLPNYKANTDVLVIRRAGTEPVALGALVANTVYFQGYLDSPLAPKGPYLDYTGAVPFDVTFPVPPYPAVPIRPFLEHIYYIATCGNCAAGDQIPTLTRRDFTGHGTFATIPIASGIEWMRVRYGVDNSSLNNGSPYQYKGAGTMVLDPDWDNVMAVEVSLVARNNETSRNYSDKKKYVLGDTTIPAANDGYRRHAFSQVVRIVNPSSRKEE